MRCLCLLFASLLLSTGVMGDPMPLPGYTWDSPVKFGEVQELGPDAYFATYPADAEYEKCSLELLLVHTPRDSVATIKEAGANPKTLTVATFLGVSGRPEGINKTLFMGASEARTVYSSSIPRPHTVHIFQKYKEDGALVTVALRDFAGGRSPTVGDVLRGIANTFISTSE